MTLFVRLKGGHVTLQRRKKGCFSIIFPKLRGFGLVPSLSIVFLSVAIASLGFFIITEVGLSQRSQTESRLLTKVRHSAHVHSRSTASSYQGDIAPGGKTGRGAAANLKSCTPSLPPVPPLGKRGPKNAQIGDYFRINPLLNKTAPIIQLSAQLILNAGFFINMRKDIMNYYNSIKCKDGGESKETQFPAGEARKSAKSAECKNFTLVSKTKERKNWWSLKPCPLYPTGLLGCKKINFEQNLPIHDVDIHSPDALRLGGWWEPGDCLARHSIAIIIPYKDRWAHLSTLLNHLHPVLKRQQIRHKIYVVEQFGNETFNKGMVMNAGFLEAMKDDIYHCFVFHDVDLIPENDENMYSCPEMPRHLSVAVNELSYELPYPELVGGALAIRPEHFFKVNGYSNFFWGWGGEDDDMAYRLKQSGLPITRPTAAHGRYTMIKHPKRRPSNQKIRMRLLATARKRFKLEGLNSVQYKLVEKRELPWFTSVLIDIGKPHPSFLAHQKLPKTG